MKLAAYVALVAVMIVGLDYFCFRHTLWPRLLANLGIVLLFAAFYLRFLQRP